MKLIKRLAIIGCSVLLLFLLLPKADNTIEPETRIAETPTALPTSVPQAVPEIVPQAVSEPVDDLSPVESSIPVPCEHSRHDPDTLLCVDCGKACRHHYANGRCRNCGRPLVLSTDEFPEILYSDAPEALRGRVERLSLSCEGKNIPVLVYLPCHYGDDPEQRYNVMILLPTINGSAESGMTAPIYYSKGASSMQTLYDNLFLCGECEPAIIVSLGFIDSFDLTRLFLRNTLLPYLAENYRTYAADAGEESLREARAHLAIGGVSNGALQTCYSGLENMVDLCANFAVLSGAIVQEEIADALNGLFAEFDIDMIFIAYGEDDLWAIKTALPLYESLSEKVDRLVPGKNLILHVIPDEDHSWNAFQLEIIDALRICFPNA